MSHHRALISEARALLDEIAADLDAQILRKQLACDQTLPYKVNLPPRNWRSFREAIAKLNEATK